MRASRRSSHRPCQAREGQRGHEQRQQIGQRAAVGRHGGNARQHRLREAANQSAGKRQPICSISSRTTLRLTSASSSATRISRRASLMFSSVERALAAKALEGALEFVGKVFKHRSTTSVSLARTTRVRGFPGLRIQTWPASQSTTSPPPEVSSPPARRENTRSVCGR